MRGIKCFKLIAVLLFVSSSVSSQTSTSNPGDYTKPIEVLPPSPNAASLGKYGGIDLSLASGTANLNIPIYDYTVRNLKVPLSLSYSSNGFRVDELSGRVGSGWNLNAGGVITRTVYGSADETSQRLQVPADFPARTRGLISFIEGLYTSDIVGPQDGQPDIFSFNFNGNSGRFILDDKLNPVLLAHSNLKIEKDFTSEDWNFKVTDADGIQYFFGGKAASESTQKTTYGVGCGKSPGSNTSKTAWYLKKIVHPKGDIVNFVYSYLGTSYTTGISETIYERVLVGESLGCNGAMEGSQLPPVLTNSACQTLLRTDGVLLQEINSSNGSKIKFSYIDRKDGNDKLLSGIEIFKPGELNSFKLFSLAYENSFSTGFRNIYSPADSKENYRPFLISVKEKSSDGLLTKNHKFSYYDFNALPPRLSYAQDHYGFFNGKNNVTLIPVPSNLAWKNVMQKATANRDVDPVYAMKGLISTVTYPTGGKDSIIYEGNQVYKDVASYPPQTRVTAYAFNLDARGAGTTVSSSITNISFGQDTNISGMCTSDSQTGGDTLHDGCSITLTDDIGRTIYSSRLKPGQSYNQSIVLEPGRAYKITVNSTGERVGCSSGFDCVIGDVTYQKTNVNTGGIRIAKVISLDGAKNISGIKKYFYNSLQTPGISSGAEVLSPLYEKDLKVYQSCPKGMGFFNIYHFYSMYSNTLNNIYVNASSPVSYRSVVESFGDNFENGGIEHQYTFRPDAKAYQLVGTINPILGAPVSDYSWGSGREIYQLAFKLQGTSYIPVKKVFTSYKEDIRVDRKIDAYVVNKEYDPLYSSDPPPIEEIEAYSLATYSHFIKWIYADTVRTQNFAGNGVDYSENISVNEYGNADHALLTKATSKTSDNQSLSSVYSYPQDLTLSGNEETARISLIDKHILSPALKTKLIKNSVQVQSNIVDYKVFSSDLTLPFNYKLAKGSVTEEIRVNIDKYDNKGNILSQSQTSGPKLCYVWSYNSQFPIAEIKNADYTTIESLLGGATAVNTFRDSNPDKSAIDAFLLPLRTSALLKDAQVISYSYEPLVGITSQTDAKGQITYYEYDSFQRLKNVKDQNGNIIKNNIYHYKN